MDAGEALHQDLVCLSGSICLSSAEAEFYAMVEAVTRAKGLLTSAKEMGLEDLSLVVHLGTDSNAAKSFVNRRGLGKMRHLEIRDLWLQKEIREGKVEVHKVLGAENPADSMTKVLTVGEIEDRLRRMSIRMKLVDEDHQMASMEKNEEGMVGPTPISTFGMGKAGNIAADGMGRGELFRN